MAKTYFIQKNSITQAKNKLDSALHEAFQCWNNHIIDENNVEMFDILFDDIVAIYIASGGRCKPWKYSRTMNGSINDEYRKIYIHVSESCSYILYPIRGEITLQNHKQ